MSEQDKIIEAAARFAQQQMEQGGHQPAAQTVQPQPVPMSVQLAGSQDGQGKKYVVLIIHHQTGQSVFHFDPDGAEHIAKALTDAARTARTGLEIVHSPLGG